MASFSAVVRLGNDAEQRQVGSNTVTSFSGAFNTGFGDKQVTTWIRGSYWRKADGLMPYLTKGAQIEISGEPCLREWESSGKSGTTLEINVDRIGLVGGNQGGQAPQQQNSQQPQQQQSQNNQQQYDPDDDIPF